MLRERVDMSLLDMLLKAKLLIQSYLLFAWFHEVSSVDLCWPYANTDKSTDQPSRLPFKKYPSPKKVHDFLMHCFLFLIRWTCVVEKSTNPFKCFLDYGNARINCVGDSR